VGHAARIGDMRNAYKDQFENLNVSGRLKDLGLEGRIILKWILNVYGVRMWPGFIWLRIRYSGRFLLTR